MREFKSRPITQYSREVDHYLDPDTRLSAMVDKKSKHFLSAWKLRVRQLGYTLENGTLGGE